MEFTDKYIYTQIYVAGCLHEKSNILVVWLNVWLVNHKVFGWLHMITSYSWIVECPGAKQMNKSSAELVGLEYKRILNNCVKLYVIQYLHFITALNTKTN